VISVLAALPVPRLACAEPGDTVRIHYTGILSDGSVFDSSRDSEPLEFVLGKGQVISGVNDAVTGMSVGEEKTVAVPAKDAYGPHREDLTLTVGRDQFPDDIQPAVGQQLQMSRAGQVFRVTVQEVADDAVVLDANQPLAGEDLTFSVELVDIR
jgi:peptidylprolyl isomerase